MKIGYIRRYDLNSNPHFTERFEFKECAFARCISSKGDRVYSELFYPLDYSEIVENAQMMKEHPGIMLVQEPFLLDDELRERCIRWVEWANKADPKEYDPFADITEGAENDS